MYEEKSNSDLNFLLWFTFRRVTNEKREFQTKEIIFYKSSPLFRLNAFFEIKALMIKSRPISLNFAIDTVSVTKGFIKVYKN